MLVHTPSWLFFLLNSVTLILAYSKLEGDLFFFTWKMTLAPTFLYLVIQSLFYLKGVIIMEKSVENNPNIKMGRFQLLDNFFHFVLSLLMLFFVAYWAFLEDLEKPGVSKKALYVTAGLYLLFQGIYTYIGKDTEESLLPITNEKKSTNSIWALVTNAVLNFLGSSFVICQGGTCSGIYGSTISAIGSAFGVSVTEWLPFLDWLTLLLVFVSIGVLYYAKKDLTYGPFLLSVAAGALIFLDSLVLHWKYPLYLGNVMMIAGALWNSRANKANLFPFAKKKKVTK